VPPASVRKGLRLLTLSAIFLGALPARAAAEWQFAPFVGWTFQIDTTLADFGQGRDDVHWTFGGAATLLGAGPVGIEGLFDYTPGFFGGGPGTVVSQSRSIALMANAVLTVPRSWNEYGLRPFVSGGLGLMDAKSEDAITGVLLVDQTLLAFNVGGGAVGFLSERTGLRFDLRYFRHLKPLAQEGESFGDIRLSHWTGTIGVVFKY
jgi:hypothetical protein